MLYVKYIIRQVFGIVEKREGKLKSKRNKNKFAQFFFQEAKESSSAKISFNLLHRQQVSGRNLDVMINVTS